MSTAKSSICALDEILSLGRRIGIFGGSFDPVHNGHIELAKLAKDSLSLDAIIFIPANRNPLKINSPLASNEARLEMLNLALAGQRSLFASDLEFKHTTEPSFSVDTLKRISQLDIPTKQQLFLLIGCDQIEKLHLWKDYKELFKLAKIIVFGRDGVDPTAFSTLNENLSKREIDELSSNFIQHRLDISSSKIRQSFFGGESDIAQCAVPKAVYDYIERSQLYKNR